MNYEIFSKLINNLIVIITKYNLVTEKILSKQLSSYSLSSLTNMGELTSKLFTKLLTDPQQTIHYQHNYLKLLLELGNNLFSPSDNKQIIYQVDNKDHRFIDQAWSDNLFFKSIQQFYLLNTNYLRELVNQLDELDWQTRIKINFFIKQLTDALSPTNFLMTNPQVLRVTIESAGDNLIKGLDNLLNDLQKNDKFLVMQTSNSDAFELGVNIAMTKGQVIAQNELLQLIRYQPIKKTNFQIPLLIIPPCINKYYVLDLKQDNSIISWLINQGYEVFIISWLNPNEQHSHLDFDDYIINGVIFAIDQILLLSKKLQINAIGYCLGGTMLSIALAYLKTKNSNCIKSATFLATLFDFKDSGEILAFIDEEQLIQLEQQTLKQGYYDGLDMNNIFSLLRANDMIWSFFINNYLLGRQPLPFDLLYWNADSTRLATKMHSFYLRNFYHQNLLIKPNNLEIDNISIDLTTLDIPCYFLSTKDDHIAPWFATYQALSNFKQPFEFILADSGHIAGVVNHPNKQKYCYWTNSSYQCTTQDWLANAKQTKGSWWLHWHNWQKLSAGKRIRINNDYPYIEAAPGSYVKVRY